tara:strand:+ start:205 stop:645 length:441 start_codon:yes stop_codon:yes gene_type:complete
MVIILLIVFIILIGYLFIKVNKKITNLKEIITYSIKSQVTENKLYLLDEIGSKSTSNLDFLYKEIEKLKKEKQDEFKTYIEDLINNKTKENRDLQILDFQKKNTETKNYIDNLHKQLISNEFAKLKLDVNKDLNNIVNSIKNVKIF